ncbi:hypothetical protein TNCV_4776781 [Trichonephila clavipes]|nr:hypothetical protein TNCV_4776781 [Trichonephila clavipes]
MCRSRPMKFIRARGHLTPVVSRSFEHHAGDSTKWFGSTPNLRKHILGVVRYLPPLSPNLTRVFTARRLFQVLPCCKGTIHLQTSTPSLGFKPKPNGAAVSVTNHYTGISMSPIKPLYCLIGKAVGSVSKCHCGKDWL